MKLLMPFSVLRQSPHSAGMLIAVFVLSVVLALNASGAFQLLSFAVYDLMVSHSMAGSMQPRVALVTITEDDITGFGEWPLSDLTVSRIFAKLEKDGPRVIGLDIYRDLPQQPGSEALEEALLDNERIIVIKKFGSAESEGVNPPALLAGSERVGFTDLIVDPGGTVRRGLLFLDDESGVSFSFSLRMAMAYLADEGVFPQPGEPNPSFIRLGGVTLAPFETDDGPYAGADAAGYQFLLDYREGLSAFSTVSLKDLFEDNYPPSTFRDKIVVIGVSAESVKDTFFTPLSLVSGELATMPGAMVHGYAASQLIRAALEGDVPLTSVDNSLEIFWIVLWGALGCLAGLTVHAFSRLFTVTLMGVAVIAGTSYVLFTHGVWLAMVPPVFSWLVVAALVTAYLSNYERMQRGALMQLFSKHVSSDIAAEIWKRRDQYLESGRLRSNKQTVTIMFTDIEHFTTVSEKLEPEALMDWLNEYMEIMANLVIKHNGVVDDYHGDAIKADFGVPIIRTTNAEVTQDARNALSCAFEMKKELKSYNRICKERGLPRLRMRVGLSTGNVIAGCLGSTQRMKFTTIGDTVNTAARIETLDKESFDDENEDSDCRILISESTLNVVGDFIDAIPVGNIILRGKKIPVQVYRVDECEIRGDTPDRQQVRA